MYQDAIAKLQQPGAVGVLPTDTLYGIVARAADPVAVERLYRLKHREHKPGTVIAASIDQLIDLGLKARYLKAVTQFWPGPVSVIIPCGQELEYLHAGLGGLAVRIPDDETVCQLLEQTGALLTSSANLSGEPTATTNAEAKKYFGETVDFYVDGGDLSNRAPSTLIRIVDDAIEVLRQGTVEITPNA
jgi:L-threonylcarbamoyladenylate synthase